MLPMFYSRKKEEEKKKDSKEFIYFCKWTFLLNAAPKNFLALRLGRNDVIKILTTDQ